MSTDHYRPAIPPDIKRIVRKRCGYGCVFCGSPIYQIDHIIDWSIVKKHEAENLTLLCGMHHDQKTHKHMISKQAVIAANSKPYALDHPDSLTSRWYFADKSPSFELATNVFMYPISESNFFAPFIVEGSIPLSFTIEDGQLLLDFVAHDKNGREIVKISKNEMLLIPQEFDIEITGSNVVVNDGNGEQLLDLVIDVEASKVKVSRIRITKGNTLIEASGSNLQMDGGGFKNFFYRGCVFETQIGINVGTPGVGAAIYLQMH